MPHPIGATPQSEVARTSTSRPRRIGIVGCGALTESSYARTLPGTGPWHVAAVTDLDHQKAARVAQTFGCMALPLDALLDEVDTVIIATPPSTHYALVTQALPKARLVFCEKPFVGTSAEAEELVLAASSAGVRLMVGHFRRVFPTLQLARDVCASGALGEVKSVRAFEGGRFTWHAVSGYTQNDKLGGVMYDTGSHTLDMVLFATGLDSGPFRCTVSAISRDRLEPSHELAASGTLSTGTHTVAFEVMFSRLRALSNHIHITLERGSLFVPIGPGKSIRMSGPLGSTTIAPTEPLATFDDAFIRQWQVAFGETDSDLFLASRFVNLTQWLQTIAEAQ